MSYLFCFFFLVFTQFIILNMRSLKTRKSMLDGLSPWEAKETDEDQNQMSQFCHQMLPRLKASHQLQQKINQHYIEIQPRVLQQKRQHKRPVSNVYSNRQTMERKSIFERLSSNQNRDMKSANKPSHPQIKFEAQPLQELNVRNYIIEGSKDCMKEVMKKKQSSYVMKQKFAQIRRSMNLQLGIWGSVNKSKERHDKQNVILRHLRYELL